MPAVTAVRGFKDILPQDIPYYTLIEEAMRKMAFRYNYQEIRPPILERTGLFQRSIGETTDIVEKEMYTFPDRHGDLLTMRPEATAGIVRALIENNLLTEGRALKLFTMGPMFRYERPQKGRLRQFNQLDVEVFGDPGPYVDAEVIDLLRGILELVGLKELIVHINSLGCPVCRPGYREKLTAFLIKRKDKLCPDCQRRLSENPLRILDCKNPTCQEQVKEAPKSVDNLCPVCLTHYKGLMDSLNALSIKTQEDPFLVRGLDYYIRTAFEVHSSDLGAQNAVAGGGRYDGLVSFLGGSDTPAIGFALGVERLVMLLREKSQISPVAPEYYLAPITEEALALALQISHALRKKGKSVQTDFQPTRLKTHLKKAQRMNASEVIIIGDPELSTRTALVKNLLSGEQTSVPFEDLLNLTS